MRSKRLNSEYTNLVAIPQGQRGATLVIALIILLVMSMIGISNMQSSTLQERMAGNAKQKTISRISAESALNVAENWLKENIRNSNSLQQFNGSQTGLYSAVRTRFGAAAPVHQGNAAISDVTIAESWDNRGVELTSTSSSSSSSGGSQSARQPRYIIEFIGRDTGTGYREVLIQDYEAKQGSGAAADIDPYLFRITAIGWGTDQKIYSVLESIYKTGYGPGNFVY